MRGLHSRPDVDQVLADAAQQGMTPEAIAHLLDRLGQARALHDPVADARVSPVRPPTGPVVAVIGTTEVANVVAAALTRPAAGPAWTVTRLVGAAANEKADRARGGPRVAVVCARDALDPRAGDPWLDRQVAMVPVVGQEHRVDIGPIVVCGDDVPCLWCLHHYRLDRDTTWPRILAQVMHDDVGHAPRAGSSLLQVAAGLVTLAVAAVVDGHPPVPGLAWQVTSPWPGIDRRLWQRHPACTRHTG